jgi:hypothetical protein
MWWVMPSQDGKGSRTVMVNCAPRESTGWHCWTEHHVQRWWPIGRMVDRLERSGLRCLSVTPIDEAAPRSRWVQVVARRL